MAARAIKGFPVQVPLNFAMGTSHQALGEVPLLLIDVETEEGVTGRSNLFGYVRAALPAIAAVLTEVEGWLEAAAIAAEMNMPMSSHLLLQSARISWR